MRQGKGAALTHGLFSIEQPCCFSAASITIVLVSSTYRCRVNLLLRHLTNPALDLICPVSCADRRRVDLLLRHVADPALDLIRPTFLA
jgi:hypothetical protein